MATGIGGHALRTILRKLGVAHKAIVGAKGIATGKQLQRLHRIESELLTAMNRKDPIRASIVGGGKELKRRTGQRRRAARKQAMEQIAREGA